MNKLFKIFTASVMLIAMLVISGCGGGDKFAGNWVTQEKNMGVEFGGNYYKQLKIEQNGDAYLLTETHNQYKLQKTNSSELSSPEIKESRNSSSQQLSTPKTTPTSSPTKSPKSSAKGWSC